MSADKPERFTLTQSAPDDTRYAPGCFDGSIGREYEAGRLVAADVAEDGRSVRLTLEVTPTIPAAQAVSFGFTRTDEMDEWLHRTTSRPGLSDSDAHFPVDTPERVAELLQAARERSEIRRAGDEHR